MTKAKNNTKQFLKWWYGSADGLLIKPVTFSPFRYLGDYRIRVDNQQESIHCLNAGINFIQPFGSGGISCQSTQSSRFLDSNSWWMR